MAAILLAIFCYLCLLPAIKRYRAACSQLERAAQDNAPRQAAADWAIVSAPATVSIVKKVLDSLAAKAPKPKPKL